MILELFVKIAFGLIIGSFLNCLIWRLNDPKAPKFWQGRSICPKCKKELGWHDNIPLFSFILLHGKCRFCDQKISWQYPIVEIITAITFIVVGFNINLILACIFIVIFFSDLKYGFIPDEMIILGVIASVAKQSSFVTGILITLPFLIFAKFKAMGYGDVKLAFLMGLLLGWPNILVAMWFAFVLGGITAGILLVLKKTKLSATIPLGPFLVLGVVLTALCAKVLLWWKL